MSSKIKLQVLLRESARTPEGMRRTEEQLRLLGIEPTQRGRASIAAEAGTDVFEAAFRTSADPPPESTPRISPTAPRAFPIPRDLIVPKPLSDLVESISIAPPATRMN